MRGFEPAGLHPLWCGPRGVGSIERLDALMAMSPLTVPSLLKLNRALLALLIAAAATVASAQERPSRPAQQQTEQHASEPRQGEHRLLPADSVTEHTVPIPGGTLAYTATAGTVSLFDQTG